MASFAAALLHTGCKIVLFDSTALGSQRLSNQLEMFYKDTMANLLLSDCLTNHFSKTKRLEWGSEMRSEFSAMNPRILGDFVGPWGITTRKAGY